MRCTVCNGIGDMPCKDCEGRGYLDNGLNCRNCDGRGEFPCTLCKGCGVIDDTHDTLTCDLKDGEFKNGRRGL